MDVVVFHGEGGRGVQVNKSFPANQSVLLHVLHKQGKSVKQTFFFNCFACLFQFSAVSSSSAASCSLKLNKSVDDA